MALGQQRPGLWSFHHQRRRPAIGGGAGRRDHRDRGWRGQQRRTAPRVHRMRQAAALHAYPVPIITRGCDSSVLKGQDGMGRAALMVGGLDGDGPGLPAGAQAHGAHLSVDADKGIGYVMVLQDLGQPVDAMTLGDPVQVQGQGRDLAGPVRVNLQCLMRGALWGLHRRADRLRVGRCRPKAPGTHGTALPDVKGPIRGAANFDPKLQDPCQIVRHGMPCANGCRVQAHQIAVGFPCGHLRIHGLDRCLQRRLHRCRIKPRRGKEQRRPARAHGRAVQRVAHKVSRHLRHSALRP